ncbi:hypothetical protein ACFOHK_16250 [Falsigemmobacter intermedius]|uniref:hypothetical protein n=1 Tax=Falsigemmobacter intermedius TaxID=1553448 RepID=UPI00157FA38F|nr:hypothetical protein [Falsigemmobacter intermedius]
MMADPGAEGIDGIMPDNGMVERVIRQLKEQCIHRHRFDSIRPHFPSKALISLS